MGDNSNLSDDERELLTAYRDLLEIDRPFAIVCVRKLLAATNHQTTFPLAGLEKSDPTTGALRQQV